MSEKRYESIIIGGGPAGLTAGIYLARARVKTLLIEELTPGGQAAVTHLIENYPGFPDGISGPELMEKFKNQAIKFGMELLQSKVIEISLKEKIKRIKTLDGEFTSPTIIISTGVKSRKLEVPGEKEFFGKGVSYCAVCDGPLFRDKVLAVIGGGDSAIKEALFLTKFASKVYIVHRRGELRAEKIIQEEAEKNERIEFIWDTVVKEIKGDQGVNQIVLEKKGEKKESILNVEGVFIYIGNIPNTELFKGILELDENRYIISKEDTSTSIKGVFVAGDVRGKLLKQIATAVGDGATSAMAVEEYLSQIKK